MMATKLKLLLMLNLASFICIVMVALNSIHLPPMPALKVLLLQGTRKPYRMDLKSAEKTSVGYLKRNIWAVKETFLKTPFYDATSNDAASTLSSSCADGNVFATHASPAAVSARKFDVDKLPVKKIEDDYVRVNGSLCYIPGTDLVRSKLKGACSCHYKKERFASQYFGPRCDIPGSVWKVHRKKRKGFEFKLRTASRRVVMGLVVDHELDFTEVRVRQLAGVVDLFVILESNVTAGGDPKPLYFYEAFKSGFLCEHHTKIVYIFLDFFPDGYVQDGWMADEFLRNAMSQTALLKISNLKEDDLFLNFDADEIPKTEVVQFLKTHDGFHSPIQANLRWTVFRYYWQHRSNMTKIGVGCTVDFLRKVYAGNVIYARRTEKYAYLFAQKEAAYNGPSVDGNFQIGVEGDYAGFHCSWCSTPEGISVKLQSAIHQDFPRWGDYPEKLDLGYISSLIKEGLWFDNSTPVNFVPESEDPDFAPEFVLRNADKFREMLTRS